MVLILLIYALTTLPLSKALLVHMQPFFLIGIRMAIAGFLLLFYHLIIARKNFKIEKKHAKDFLGALIFEILVPYYARYWAIANSSGQMVDMLCYAGPLFTYLYTAFLRIEQFSLLKAIALCLGYAGLIAYKGIQFSAIELPECAILFSVICFVYGWSCIQRLVVNYHYAPLFINGFTMLAAGIIALLIAGATESMTVAGDWWHCLMLLAAIIGISNIFAHTLYVSLLQKYSLTFIQLCSFVAPLCVEYRILLFGQSGFSWQLLTATLLIIISVTLFYADERRHDARSLAVRGI
ncbi:hypothetical protein BH09DEP1_BH09DEP1_6350 [soil metagenome]